MNIIRDRYQEGRLWEEDWPNERKIGSDEKKTRPPGRNKKNLVNDGYFWWTKKWYTEGR